MNATSPSAPQVGRNRSGPALRAYFAITRKWGLNEDQERRLLGLPRRSTFLRWKRQNSVRLSNDVIERISYVLGIYGALRSLFADAGQADGWIKRSNLAPLFCGRSALERMLAGQVADLYLVRRYLDAQRGPG